MRVGGTNINNSTVNNTDINVNNQTTSLNYKAEMNIADVIVKNKTINKIFDQTTTNISNSFKNVTNNMDNSINQSIQVFQNFEAEAEKTADTSKKSFTDLGGGIQDAAGSISGLMGSLASVSPDGLASIFDTIGGVSGIIGNAVGVVMSLSSAFTMLSAVTGIAMAPLIGIVAAIAAVIAIIALVGLAVKYIWDTNEGFRSSMVSLWDSFMGKISEFMALAQPVFDALIIAFNQIMEALAPFIEAIATFFMTLVTGLMNIFIALAPVIMPILTFFIEQIAGCFTWLMSIITPLWEALTPMIEAIFAAIMPLIQGFVDGVIWLWGLIGEPIMMIFDGIKSYIANIIGTIISVIGGLISFVTNVFSGNWQGAWDDIVGIFGSIFDGIGNMVKIPINTVVGVVNWVIEKINGFGFTIPDWVPMIGGSSFSLGIPSIPMLANGGTLMSGGMAIVGEAGPEMLMQRGAKTSVIPLTSGQRSIGKDGGENDNIIIQLNLDGKQVAQVVNPHLKKMNTFDLNLLLRG